MERATATAADEHEDDAAPKRLAIVNERGDASGSSCDICDLDTASSITAESSNPRLNV